MGGECSKYGGEEWCVQGLVGRLEGKRPLQELGVDESIILKWMFKNWDDKARIGLLCSRIGTDCGRL